MGGTVLARRGFGLHNVVLSDINEHALQMARVNAELAELNAEVVQSDVLDGVKGDFDLAFANPDRIRRSTQPLENVRT